MPAMFAMAASTKSRVGTRWSGSLPMKPSTWIMSCSAM